MGQIRSDGFPSGSAVCRMAGVVDYGTKLRPEREAKRIAGVRTLLLVGEEPLLLVKCNNFRPTTERILVTNMRLLGLTSQGISIELPLYPRPQISSDPKKETLQVAT